jgi:hypothetical protein
VTGIEYTQVITMSQSVLTSLIRSEGILVWKHCNREVLSNLLFIFTISKSRVKSLDHDNL